MLKIKRYGNGMLTFPVIGGSVLICRPEEVLWLSMKDVDTTKYTLATSEDLYKIPYEVGQSFLYGRFEPAKKIKLRKEQRVTKYPNGMLELPGHTEYRGLLGDGNVLGSSPIIALEHEESIHTLMYIPGDEAYFRIYGNRFRFDATDVRDVNRQYIASGHISPSNFSFRVSEDVGMSLLSGQYNVLTSKKRR